MRPAEPSFAPAAPAAPVLDPTDKAKIVMLGGVPTVFEGAEDDAYFQGLHVHAAELGALQPLVERHVPRGATVIDVGANIGLSTILLARLAGHVVAFEPSPPNAAFLRRNLARNGIRNVEVREAAASSQSGALRFHVAQFGAGSHVVAAGHVLGDTITDVEVPAVTLDAGRLPPVAFIKIDAEGHEPDVLAGARGLLAEHRPMIYMEVNVWCLCAFAGHSPGALIRALWKAFEVFSPTEDGSLSPLPDPYGFLHDTIVYHRGLANIVLRPREDATMPDLAEMTWPEPAMAVLRAGAARASVSP